MCSPGSLGSDLYGIIYMIYSSFTFCATAHKMLHIIIWGGKRSLVHASMKPHSPTSEQHYLVSSSTAQ